MAATLDELMAQYAAQQKMASSQAQSAVDGGLALASGATGLVGAIAAPIAARYIGDAFGLNKRSAAEEAALKNIRDVASGSARTAAQTALEYQRGRTARMATQAAAAGPARERAARELVGQEQNIGAQQDLTGQLATVKAQEQARAQQVLTDIETRAGEAERNRQRQMVAGAVTGGLGALAQSYGGYLAGKQREKDLQAQAAGAGAALQTIQQAQQRQTPAQAAQVMGQQPVAAAPPVAAPQAPPPAAMVAQMMPDDDANLGLSEIPASKLAMAARARARGSRRMGVGSR